MSAESNSSRSNAIDSSDEFQIINAGKSEMNEQMLNLSVFEEAIEGITLMMSVHEAGNEDKMSDLEETNDDLMSVSNEEYAILMSMPVEKNKNMMHWSYIELYRKVENFYGCYHISCLTTDNICINEGKDIIHINKTGDTHLFQHYLPEFAFNGLHTMEKESELIYIDSDYDIYRLSLETEKKIPLLQTNSTTWKPHCVYCSPFSRDLLVGMFRKDLKIGMVIRYSNTGELKQSIICDKFGQELYNEPRYITENNNGDVVVSDSDWETGAVVVTDRGGQHRFTYTGNPSGSGLLPRGICTDRMSHIIVCDSSSKKIHVIDEDGRFLSYVFIDTKLMSEPSCLSYAFRNDLFLVGSYNGNKIGVCKYVTEKNKARTGKYYHTVFY